MEIQYISQYDITKFKKSVNTIKEDIEDNNGVIDNPIILDSLSSIDSEDIHDYKNMD